MRKNICNIIKIISTLTCEIKINMLLLVKCNVNIIFFSKLYKYVLFLLPDKSIIYFNIWKYRKLIAAQLYMKKS